MTSVPAVAYGDRCTTELTAQRHRLPRRVSSPPPHICDDFKTLVRPTHDSSTSHDVGLFSDEPRRTDVGAGKAQHESPIGLLGQATTTMPRVHWVRLAACAQLDAAWLGRIESPTGRTVSWCHRREDAEADTAV